jgi:hypothetical protein
MRRGIQFFLGSLVGGKRAVQQRKLFMIKEERAIMAVKLINAFNGYFKTHYGKSRGAYVDTGICG